jgi:hypothetical protein
MKPVLEDALLGLGTNRSTGDGNALMNQATKWAWEADLGILRSESPQGERAGASESNK